MNVDCDTADQQAGVALATPDEAAAPLEHASMLARRDDDESGTDRVTAESWLPATTPSPRRQGDEYYWVSADADDRKNSIIGYLTLLAPLIIAALGLYYVTR